MQELAYKGWLEGPTPEMSWMFLLARRWLHVRRFAVWQRSKWTAIDDLSECGVNLPLPTSRKFYLKPLDAVDWMACCFVKFCIFEERLDFTLLFEVPLSESVDKAWRDIPTESTQLVVKTIDLKAAYKQFPIFPDHRKLSILVLKRSSCTSFYLHVKFRMLPRQGAPLLTSTQKCWVLFWI